MDTRSLSSLLGALVLNTSLALAQSPPPGTPPPSTAARQTAGPEQRPPVMPRLHDNQTKMQDLMAKIHASKEPSERQELMQEHMKLMQEQMGMMHGMGGMQGMRPGQHGKMKHGGKMNHESMESRMDHMEMMMQQMLQHQDAEHDSRATK